MPQLLLLAAVGAGVYLGIKWAKGNANLQKTRPDHKKAEPSSAQQQKKNAENLKQDPVSGVYRVDD